MENHLLIKAREDTELYKALVKKSAPTQHENSMHVLMASKPKDFVLQYCSPATNGPLIITSGNNGEPRPSVIASNDGLRVNSSHEAPILDVQMPVHDTTFLHEQIPIHEIVVNGAAAPLQEGCQGASNITLVSTVNAQDILLNQEGQQDHVHYIVQDDYSMRKTDTEDIQQKLYHLQGPSSKQIKEDRVSIVPESDNEGIGQQQDDHSSIGRSFYGRTVVCQPGIRDQQELEEKSRLKGTSVCCQSSTNAEHSPGYMTTDPMSLRDHDGKPYQQVYRLTDEVTIIPSSALRRKHTEDVDIKPKSFYMEHSQIDVSDLSAASSPSSSCVSLPTMQSFQSTTLNVSYVNDGTIAVQEDSKRIDRPPSLRRSLSDQGQYDHRLTANQMDCAPLDLSMNSRSPSIETVHSATSSNRVLKYSNSMPPKLNLDVLADAVSFIIENDPETSEAFHSSRSTPCSLSESNSSQSTSDEKPHDDYRYIDSPPEFLTVSQEGSLDGLQEIKCEMSDNFETEGIILNSNVSGDKVYQEKPFYYPIDIPINYEENDDRVLKEVPNFNGNILMELEYHYEAQMYAHQNLDESAGVYGDGGNSSADGSQSDGMRGVSHHDAATTGEKRRLRLGKAEYESMSEEARRVRHRVLDNQRSKQYRERRRRQQRTLQTEAQGLQERHETLFGTLTSLQRQRDAMRSALQKTKPLLVKSGC